MMNIFYQSNHQIPLSFVFNIYVPWLFFRRKVKLQHQKTVFQIYGSHALPK